MRRWLLAACAAALLLGCPPPVDKPDAGDAGPDVDGGYTACVERPTDGPSRPGGPLPCDLLPPGFAQ